MKKAMLALGLTAVACVTGLVRADEPDWKDFTSKEGRFTVKTPDEPLSKKKTTATPFGKTEMTMFGGALSADDGIAYVVGYLDLPKGVAKTIEKDDDGLETILKGFARAIPDGKVIAVKKTTLGANVGREAEIEALGGASVVRTRAYLVDGRVYIVMVMSPKDAADNAVIDRFFDSFQLTK
jgi:hypothetical protein